MQVKLDECIKSVRAEFCAYEIEHLNICGDLLVKYEKMDIRDLLKDDKVEPLIVFEPNKEYVNKVLDTQVSLRPYNTKFVSEDKLPSDWKSFEYQKRLTQSECPRT